MEWISPLLIILVVQTILLFLINNAIRGGNALNSRLSVVFATALDRMEEAFEIGRAAGAKVETDNAALLRKIENNTDTAASELGMSGRILQNIEFLISEITTPARNPHLD